MSSSLRTIAIAAVVTAAFVVPVAGAPAVGRQSSLVRALTIPVRVEGSVQVEFASSTAAGCERRCNLSGTLAWNPTQLADLAVREDRSRAGGELAASLFFFGGVGEDAPRTTAHVVRERPDRAGVCSDARSNPLTFLDFSARAGSHVQVRLLAGTPGDASLFRSRCGGPLERDLVSALPSARLTRTEILKGETTVDLSGVKGFAAHGFAGTVRSTVKLRLQKPREEPSALQPGSARALPASAPRTVLAVYDVEHVRGSIVTDFQGGTDPSVCDRLDACGVSGTVRMSPLVSSGRATFAAYGPTRRVSGRDLRVALGLQAGRVRSGIEASGVAGWSDDAGNVVESFTDDGGTPCTDSVALPGGFMTFSFGPRRVFASYGRASGDADVLRTHCPGPSILDAAQNRPLATGTVERSAFRKRRVTIELSRGRPFEAEPYAGETHPALEIVLRRMRVRETRSLAALPEP
jgi:hypothetical protein